MVERFQEDEEQKGQKVRFNLHLSRPSKKTAVIITAVVMVVAVILLILFVFDRKTEAPKTNTTGTSEQNEKPDEPGVVSMLATGDWIAHDAINAAAKSGDSYSYVSMTEPFKPYFEKSDVNFCNLATLAGGDKYGVTGYPIFNAPLQWNTDMNSLGCNLYNTGTNHTNDKGQAPITSELDHLDTLPDVLAHAGANRSTEEQNKVRYFDVKGVKFAMLSYSTYSNTPNPNPYSLNRFEEPLVTDQMTEARSKADIVVVSMRWGTEYSNNLNAAQNTAAQKLANLGADIVLGHGTHTLQPVQRLTGADGRETIVWFGLGNFLNAQMEVGGLTGCVADFKIDTTSKKVTSSMCLPFYMHYEWSAEDKAAERLLNRSNFLIMPLYKAQDYLAKSQLDTTEEEQMARINKTVNTYTEVTVINADDQ